MIACKNHAFPFSLMEALAIVLLFCAVGTSRASIQIRVNQAGFLPQDSKSAAVFSSSDLKGEKCFVVDAKNHGVAYEAALARKSGSIGKYIYFYTVDFSAFRAPGQYDLKIAGTTSYAFVIGETVYNTIVDSLLMFFRQQRCGPTNPLGHNECHLHDATRLVFPSSTIRTQFDVTGGWHYAGDYVNFLTTAAFSTYTLLFSYDFDSAKFAFDKNANHMPDVLEEAKVGLDWLSKLAYKDYTLITQVQDLRDHDQEWRKPEADLLARDRPAFVGTGKNLIGIYAATMALASRIWRRTLHDEVFADRCLTLAEDYYSVRDQAPNIDSTGTGMYRDTRYLGKLALAAIELYLATDKKEYLDEARAYADSAGSDYWWSWGDINAFAQYRLAKVEPRFKDYIYDNLKFFNNNSTKQAFSEAVNDSWGSNTTVLGAALQAILWRDITGKSNFDTLAQLQRDFILGRNQWGVSFVYGIGTRFSRHLHSQVATFNGGCLTGAVAAGPISEAKLEAYRISYDLPDDLVEFQTHAAVYRDDRMDYVTNEPTITTNAVAVFVMGYYSRRGF